MINEFELGTPEEEIEKALRNRINILEEAYRNTMIANCELQERIAKLNQAPQLPVKSLRDEIAIAAMQGIIIRGVEVGFGENDTRKHNIQKAFKYADEFLKQREVKEDE